MKTNPIIFRSSRIALVLLYTIRIQDRCYFCVVVLCFRFSQIEKLFCTLERTTYMESRRVYFSFFSPPPVCYFFITFEKLISLALKKSSKNNLFWKETANKACTFYLKHQHHAEKTRRILMNFLWKIYKLRRRRTTT